MKSNYRLTVHVENQPKVDTKPSTNFEQKGRGTPLLNAVDRAREQAKKNREFKMFPKSKDIKESNKGRYKVYTTLSFYHKTKVDCLKRLSDVRSKYDIVTGKDINKPKKYNKELYNISFVN